MPRRVQFENAILNTLNSKAEEINPKEGMGERVKSAVISGNKKRRLILRRPMPFYGKAAIITLVVLTLAFHGSLMAVANNAVENITKILKIGNYISIIQETEDTATDYAGLSQQDQETLRKGGKVTVQTPGGEVTINGKTAKEEDSKAGEIHYSNLVEAQKAVCFKVFNPEYLPSGYSFKEARGYKGSDEFINLFFKGSGKDIILMQSIMNQDTQFVMSTNGSKKTVDINGVQGFWDEPSTLTWEKDGVGCYLVCKGFSKEEAMKIARSIN